MAKPGRKGVPDRKLDPKILIFDVDGVLVDVRETYWRSGLQTLQYLTGKKATWAEFREWKRKPELIYDAKRLSADEKPIWTLALLQDGASRVATHANPADHDELMDVLTRRYTDGNDAFHHRHALVNDRPTGDHDRYVDKFLELSSRVPDLTDA